MKNLRATLLGLIACIWACLNAERTYGQATYYPSPDASALIKAADISPDMSRGVASIQVPLFQLPTQGNVQVPVLLNYVTSGIKVTEVASVIGAGWNLVAGGKITRIVRGRPDFPDRDYLCSKTEAVKDAGQYYLEECDPSPDIFVFEFLGRTGRFYLNDEGKPFTQPYQDIDISFSKAVFSSEATYDPGHNYMFRGWVITTEDGLKYYFGNEGAKEESKVLHHDYGNDVASADVVQHLISTWHLEKVVSPDGIELAAFNYSAGSSIDVTTRHQSLTKRMINSAGQYEYETSTLQNVENKVITYRYYPHYLQSIVSSFGTIDFTYSSSRNDLPNGKRLTAVTVKDHGNAEVKKYELQQDYFKPTDARKNTLCTGTDPFAPGCWSRTSLVEHANFPEPYRTYFYYSGDNLPDARLRLNQINVAVGGDDYLYRRFVYNDKNLPPYNSDFIDGYGFYNGSDIKTGYDPVSDQSNMPYSQDVPVSIGWTPDNCEGGSGLCYTLQLTGSSGLGAVFEDAKANILEEVHFPTGGYQKLLYGHLTGKPSFIRVDQVSTFDENDIEVDKVTYDYSEPQTFGNAAYHFRQKIDNGMIAVVSSKSFSSFTDFEGSLVRYAKVSATKLDGSKIEREFSNYEDNLASKELYRTATGEVSGEYNYMDDLVFPFNSNTSRFWDRGLMLRETIYPDATSTKKVTEVEYVYKTSENSNLDVTPSYVALWHEHNYNPSTDDYAFVATVNNRSRPVLLDHKIERTYDQENDNYESVQTNYTYNASTLQLTKTEVVSDGYPSYTSEYKYATDVDYDFENPELQACINDLTNCEADCANDAYYDGIDYGECSDDCRVIYDQCVANMTINISEQADAIQRMRQRHMINVPIEQKNWIKEGGATQLMSANLTIYGLEGANNEFIRPKEAFVINGLRTDYSSSNDSYVDASGNFIKSSHFRKIKTFDNYDQTSGQLLSETDLSGISTGYEWDTNNNYLLATVVNGKRSETTYQSLVGKATETDANGNVTTYIYDDQNRLKQVKVNGDIVKQYSYQLIDEK